MTKTAIRLYTIILLQEEYRCIIIFIRVNISLNICYYKINDLFKTYENIHTCKEGLLVKKMILKISRKNMEFILLIHRTVNKLSKRLRLVILTYPTGQ